MKKLMVAMVSAASAIFAFGDLPHGADFEAEGFVVGESFTNYLNKNDQGIVENPFYWYSDSDEIGVISNGVHNAPSVPDMYEGAASAKYLQLESTNRLYRTIKDNGNSGENWTGVDMATGDGVYLDTLVKFTAAADVFEASVFEGGDKIAIEYVERDDPALPALTNFVIRAGVVGSDTTNYVATVTNTTLNMADWHRLTVRTIADIGGGRPGFKIYLDTYEMVYLTNNDEFAKSAGIPDDTHTIFPSAVSSGDFKTTISAVAFSGNGLIDDVVFTTETPEFIESSEPIVATFTADAGVTGISVQVGEAEPIVVDRTDLSAILPPGTTEFTVTATIDGGNDYAFASMTYGGSTYNTNPATITGYAGGAIAITTTRNNFSLFDENGDPISGTFETLGAALAAQGVAKIQLAYDYDVTDADLYGGYINIDQSTTLDLNGKTLDGGVSVSDPLFTVNDGNFVIIDSVGGGKVVYDGPGIVFGSTSYIGATSGDLGPTFDGQLFFEGGVGRVVRGKFDETSNTTSSGEPAFLWEARLGDGDSVESECKGLVSGYWVVEPKGSIIGTYSVTVIPTNNTTYAAVYNDGGAAVEFVNHVAAVTVGKTITITVTPDSNYEYASAPDGWTLSEGVITKEISAAAEVAIPAPTAVSSSELDPASNTPVEIEAESEVAATNAVQLVTPTGVDPAAYKDLFDFTVTPVVQGEKYEVEIAGIKESVEVSVEESAMDVLAEVENAKVQVPAGLYYKITTYTTLGGSAINTTSDLSDGTGVSVSKPGTTQGFIKIEMATVPFN